MSISDVADRLLMPGHRPSLSLPVVDDERRVLGLVSRYTLRVIFITAFRPRPLGPPSGAATS